MPRDGSGVYSTPSGTNAVANQTIESAPYNAFLADLVSDLNAARPLTAGGTGVTSLADLKTLLGVDNIDEIRDSLGGFRNKIINGNFDIWQRATSQTTSGYGSVDRWSNLHAGSTKTTSQQSFTNGQTDVVGNPEFFMRTIVSSVSAAGNLVVSDHRIEKVKTFSGKTATLTFYAKADSAKDIAVELFQYFGTGGSPSSTVDGFSATTCTLSTAWQKFSYTIAIPSISGKTIGSDNNDYLDIRFWFDAGSNFDANTNTLGQQSGTFDIARVSLVEGDATLEDDPYETRHISQELELCMRYYERMNILMTVQAGIYNAHPWRVRKRAIPTFSYLDSSGGVITGGNSDTLDAWQVVCSTSNNTFTTAIGDAEL